MGVTTRNAVWVLLALWAGGVHAATIRSMSPQGEVARVEQVAISFAQAVVPMGQRQSPRLKNRSIAMSITTPHRL